MRAARSRRQDVRRPLVTSLPEQRPQVRVVHALRTPTLGDPDAQVPAPGVVAGDGARAAGVAQHQRPAAAALLGAAGTGLGTQDAPGVDEADEVVEPGPQVAGGSPPDRAGARRAAQPRGRRALREDVGAGRVGPAGSGRDRRTARCRCPSGRPDRSRPPSRLCPGTTTRRRTRSARARRRRGRPATDDASRLLAGRPAVRLLRPGAGPRVPHAAESGPASDTRGHARTELGNHSRYSMLLNPAISDRDRPRRRRRGARPATRRGRRAWSGVRPSRSRPPRSPGRRSRPERASRPGGRPA